MHFPSTFSSHISLLKEEDNLNENEVERVMMALLRSDDARSEGRKFQRWSQRRRWSWWTKICFHFQSEGKKSGGMELRGEEKRKWRSPVVYRLNFLQANIWHRLGYSNAPLLSSAPTHPPPSCWKDFVFCCCQSWFSGRPDSTTKCVSRICSLSKLLSMKTMFAQKEMEYLNSLQSWSF